MAVPETIPIGYEPDYHTDDWLARKRWYAVLHTFDATGHYLGSRIERTGTDADRRASVDTAQDLLNQWLNALPGRRFGDIAVRPFRREFDDVLFGLVIETFEGDEHAELYPDNIGFYEPWDGSYDT
ncbi:hypothetical protein [Nonomuraea sp. LPB2021202275-12-8]|uniref:hypothetical protein n=1 Tax=Nonomuraea sp. LPB2021202275-12-8 TaxID=3120159 RepID=UPI00300D2557